ncbi:uncharacterized protein METZ01_LOCUS299550 [marine metagenome]|jgi:hypothetical protein|uniref:Uncharacterized protein n=1 Tax=marine metagenome TaxID=408172 RepID=A0A382MD18_9ZZZZ
MSSNRTPAIIVAVAIIVGSSMICFSIDVVVDQRERLHKEEEMRFKREMDQLESIRDTVLLLAPSAQDIPMPPR